MKQLFFASLILLPIPAFAYLDPGSGNALLYLLISLLSGLIYFIKSFFYRILAFFKGEKYQEKRDADIVIFSEGKNYYRTFKPIIEDFIKKEVHFSYLTIDVEDPALTIESPYMHAKYVGDGNRGFYKIASTRALVMLSTTPNIGCADFPLPRPEKIQCLAHIWHSVCDTSFYLLGALDHYDSALTVGNWVESSLRIVEEKRKLKAKEVAVVGLPYLDELSLHVADKHHTPDDKKTLLIAPSWGEKNALIVYGTDFIKQLAQNNQYDIIIRPHPQSLKVEMDFIQKLQNECKSLNNIRFDFAPSGDDSMRQADLLISDKSSIRFDFAFLYERPVLTLDIPLNDLSAYEATLLDGLWEEKQADKIGMRLTPDEKDQIVVAVAKALAIEPKDIRAMREHTIANWQHSAQAITHWAIEKVNTLKKANA